MNFNLIYKGMLNLSMKIFHYNGPKHNFTIFFHTKKITNRLKGDK